MISCLVGISSLDPSIILFSSIVLTWQRTIENEKIESKLNIALIYMYRPTCDFRVKDCDIALPHIYVFTYLGL